ncbi:MAG: CBS domain-containing protein [Bdellovibrionota bacterium]
MRVREIMSSNLLSLNSTSTVREAAELMFENDIRHLPIIDGDVLVGIISDRDLNGYAWSFRNDLTESDNEVPGTRVSQLMHKGVITTDPETDLPEIIETMLSNKIGAVIVTDSVDSSRAIGIVSYEDILRATKETLQS